MFKPLRFLLAAGFLLLLTAGNSALAQTKFIEKVTAKPGEIVIPYEKYVLANGLTVVVHEDHSDPLVHVDITYHVGSAREEIGKSGFAHFFEHMMFQGSDNVGDEQHFKIVTEAGGTLNGTTNRDRTNYFETVPSNQLEIALWLEADRMGFLLDAVTQQKFEVQRATVKNERGQNYDNRPYGLSREIAAKNLYPFGHPYSWLTIGYVEDLNRVNVDDLKRFFLRWYGPNNATLTVGGDVNPAEVVKLAEKYFGSIPAGPAVSNMAPMPAVLPSSRYVSYVDNYIRFPMYMRVYPSVPQNHADEVALDALSDILGSGKSSYFYQNFVKTRKAQQANVFHPTSELSGEFTIQMVTAPGQKLSSMDSLTDATIAEFAAKGVTEEQVERFKNGREAQLINGLESVTGKVSQLASSQTFTGNPNRIAEELKEIRALTVADVKRVFEQYIAGKNFLVVSVLPKGGTVEPAKPDNYKVDESGYTAPADMYAGLTYTKPKDSFDRSKKPAPGKNPVVSVPPYWTSKLKNGVAVIGAANNEVPTVNLRIQFKGGKQLEPVGKAGLASLTATMLREGTETKSAEAFEEAVRNLGSSINFSAQEEYLILSVSSLVKNLDATLALAHERLFKSKFVQADFDRNKENAIKGIQNRNTQPAAVAEDVFSTLLYGTADVRGLPITGTETSVAAISLDDVTAFYKTILDAGLTSVVVVGDLDQKTALGKLGFLEALSKNGTKLPVYKTPALPAKTTVYLVDVPKAAQSQINVGYVALPYDATGAYYKATLMNYILGGNFNSRINLNLREAKGWTYGARSGFIGFEFAGPFSAGGGFKAGATDSSLAEIMKEIALFREKGVTEEELAFLKSSIGQRDARAYETGFQKAAFLARIQQYGLKSDFVKKQNDIVSKLTAAEVKKLAGTYLKPENFVIVVVGDKASVKPGLEKLGYPVVEVDRSGKPL